MYTVYSYLWNIPINYINNAQVNEAIKTKYLAQGHKYVGTSGARTHNLAFWSPAAVPQDHIYALSKFKYFFFQPLKLQKSTKMVKHNA